MADSKKQDHPYGWKYHRAVCLHANCLGVKSGPMGTIRALLSYLNKTDGTAYPSKKTLGAAAGGSDRSSRRHIALLEDMGVIEAVAYRTGGHGRSTVWKFTLPPWTNEHNYPAKLAELTKTYPAKLSKYPANLSKYPAKLAYQPKEQNITEGEKGAAGRGQDGSDRLRGHTFGELVNREGYGEARRLWNEREKEALRAAENGQGLENSMQGIQKKAPAD